MKLSFVSSVVATSLMFAVSAFAGPQKYVLGLADGSKYVVVVAETKVHIVILKPGKPAVFHIPEYAASFSNIASPGTYILPGDEILNVQAAGSSRTTITRYEMKSIIVQEQGPDREFSLVPSKPNPSDISLLTATGAMKTEADGYKTLKLASGNPEIGTYFVQENLDSYDRLFFRVQGGEAELLEIGFVQDDPGVNSDGQSSDSLVELNDKYGNKLGTLSFSGRGGKILRAGDPVGVPMRKPVASTFDLHPTALTSAEIAQARIAIGEGMPGVCAGLAAE